MQYPDTLSDGYAYGAGNPKAFIKFGTPWNRSRLSLKLSKPNMLLTSWWRHIEAAAPPTCPRMRPLFHRSTRPF